jgi:hypothetical protein
VTRKIVWILVALLALGVGARFLPADLVRPSVERALERGLGRKVEVGEVHFNLLGAPGFTIDGVTIYEDPRAGIEPFAYVDSLDAQVRLWSLFRHRLEFSSLDLGDATINVVKTAAGPWNFQFLLGDEERREAANPAAVIPSIKVRGGRVNFKFGDTKSVFFFDDADLDVAPQRDGSVELRFGGAPSRTDRSQQDFGRFYVNGEWTTQGGPRLNLSVELERSSLDEVSRLIDPAGFALHGIIALQAQLSGPLQAVQVTGRLQADKVYQGDVLLNGGSWSVPVEGSLDLHQDKLELASGPPQPPAPLALQFRAWDFLSSPRWEAGAHLNKVPLAALLDVFRHMGATFPDDLAAEGGVSGDVSYTKEEGLAGQFELSDATLRLPDAQPLRASSARIGIAEGTLRLEPSVVEVGTRESAQIEGSYTLQAPRALDLRISTRGLSIADMRSFGLAAIPVLEHTTQGTWKGWARYRGNEWSGEYQVQNARIAVQGLSDPVHIHSAMVILSGSSLTVSEMQASLGKISFTGDYFWDPDAARQHQFEISIPQVDLTELERQLAPTLDRQQGFLARTLRLGPAPLPAWLKARHAVGTLSIAKLTAGDWNLNLDEAQVLWDAGMMRVAGIHGRAVHASTDPVALAGNLDADLGGAAPHYRFNGKIAGVSYRGGKLNFEGTLKADGVGAQDLLETAHADGEVRGRSIAFTPDISFQTVYGCFQMQNARWKLSSVEVTQGTDIYTGASATQPDGKLVLDLTRAGKPVRYTAPLLALAP